ncbi:MAG TPA: membrane lipoprotein lipid attachment site-containing protein [Opitutaceae bacterium]
MRKSFLFLVVAAALAGCSTFERRAEEKSATFNQLDEATRQRLKDRDITVGDTQDMVYIALGVPDEKRDRLSLDGSETTWVYNAYWQEYQGQALVGYRRHVVFDPGSRRYRVYYTPVSQSVYAEREEERIRVTFNNGTVSSVEQVK